MLRFQIPGAADGRKGLDSHASQWFRINRPTESFPITVVALEIVVIVLTSVATGTAYHAFAYDDAGPLQDFSIAGALAAFWYVLLFCYRLPYRPENFLDNRRGFGNVLVVWTSIFVGLLLIGFLTKTSDVLSRGWLVLFYGFGLGALTVVDTLVSRNVAAAARAGRLNLRRLMLVGTQDTIDRFLKHSEATPAGVLVTCYKVLPPIDQLAGMAEDELRRLMRGGVEDVRGTRITDIVLLVPPQHMSEVNRIADTLTHLPAAIHLGGLDVLEQFPAMRVEQVGRVRTIMLVRQPLTFAQQLLKRALDVTIAGAALVLLMPVFVVVGVLIKLDSNGPVFFRQRRRGYNQVEFRIYKFRSMTTMDDGPSVVQAMKGDARITRLGAFLRRSNIDELPQIINVLRGEMSLVGPRPHAVAHDVKYEALITQYARRLNVKPGITGWAQINGLRGPTTTDAAMRARVEHDLHYVDNWSMWLDIKILWMTVFSRKAYRNAF